MATVAALQTYLREAKSLARIAGAVQRGAHDGDGGSGAPGFTIDSKSLVDLVTSVDRECESIIFSKLKRLYPDHKFIGEESASEVELSSGFVWCVDPVDGTTNFVHAYPAYCVSIGLFYEKKPVLGVIYDPSGDRMYTAVKGGGAFCNNVPMSVDSSKTLPEAVVATNFGHSRDPEVLNRQIGSMQRLAYGNIRGVRMVGSCCVSMCRVAEGVLSGYYEEMVGGLWDVAAGSIIVEEAGGVVVNMKTGSPYTYTSGKQHILCGNATIVQAILDKL